MESKLTGSEVMSASQFAEQNRMIKSLVITLANSKNENIESFNEINNKLGIIHQTSESSQEALALTIEHERSGTDALVKREVSLLKSDLSSISSKLDELSLKSIPAKSPAKTPSPSLPPCDLSRPPPPLKKAGPISTLGIYKEAQRRSRSKSCSRSRSRSCRRSRSRGRTGGRSSNRSRSRNSAREGSMNWDAARDRSRSRIRERSASRSREARRSCSRAASRSRAESRTRAVSQPRSRSRESRAESGTRAVSRPRSRSRSREHRSNRGQEM